MVALKSWGCRKVKIVSGTQARSYNVAPGMHRNWCEVRCCCTAAVGLPVCCAGAFEIQRCGLESPLAVFRMTRTRTDTYTHRRTVRGCHKRNTLKCCCCCTMAATTYKGLGGRGDTYLQHSISKQYSDNDKEAEITALCAPSSYCLL